MYCKPIAPPQRVAYCRRPSHSKFAIRHLASLVLQVFNPYSLSSIAVASSSSASIVFVCSAVLLSPRFKTLALGSSSIVLPQCRRHLYCRRLRFFLCFSVRGLEQFAVGSPLSVISLLAVRLSVEAVGISLSERKARYSYASLWVLLSTLAFVVVCILVFKPLVSWMIHKTPEEQPFSETQICIVLTGVMISAFITDALWTHAVFGAFVYGLVIPNGPLAAAIIEKLEDFVSGLLLPLFFAISGLKTNLTLIKGAARWDL
ncbi:cation/H(+) antiporter 15-like [Arachis stenosperma]|uniref:cation/H(+) antiporter 15-like n=1 Tax=Arachis stenosperma TaxID=217475 RepID=UPI0025ACB97C|nr:cation/H(+) antiporter 15-like [Arachis stenosperma]